MHSWLAIYLLDSLHAEINALEMFVATEALSFHDRAENIPFTDQFSMGFTQLLTEQTFDDWLRATNEFSIANIGAKRLNPMTIDNHNIPFLTKAVLDKDYYYMATCESEKCGNIWIEGTKFRTGERPIF
nr:uncharacterized protein LOC117280121 [Nicotiana tomentosiformis]